MYKEKDLNSKLDIAVDRDTALSLRKADEGIEDVFGREDRQFHKLFVGHDKPISEMVWSPLGVLLATCDESGLIKL